jgi:micrococcal nuclease
MSGTRIENLKLLKVIDGDTVKIELNGDTESLRLACLDTEESIAGSSKPVTNAGKQASLWAKEYFNADEKGLPQEDVRIDIEFDTRDPVNTCLKKHRGNFGRLICYVYKDGENYNHLAVQKGWSPYFVKYGCSRLYDEVFTEAESLSMAKGIGVWDKTINEGGETRNYGQLIPWWHLRSGIVDDYRRNGIQAGVKSVRLDYQDILSAASSEEEMTVLCDLQRGISKRPGKGALIYAGSLEHKFNLWIPNRDAPEAVEMIRLIENRYAGYGRSYVYVSGKAMTYKDIPEIVLKSFKQLSDCHWGPEV